MAINIEDNAEFEYGSSSDIPFTITNRTEVRVIITNADGRTVFNKTTSDDFVMLDLAAGDYNITVYNLGNKTHAPSKDSKLFKILKVLIEAADAKYGLGDSYAYGAKFVLENGLHLKQDSDFQNQRSNIQRNHR